MGGGGSRLPLKQGQLTDFMDNQVFIERVKNRISFFFRASECLFISKPKIDSVAKVPIFFFHKHVEDFKYILLQLSRVYLDVTR